METSDSRLASWAVLLGAAALLGAVLLGVRALPSAEAGAAPSVTATPTVQPTAPPTAAPTAAIPLPAGERLVALLDPAVVQPSVTAAEALAVARALVPTDVGAAPYVQLMHTDYDDPETPDFEGWVILSTDLPMHWIGSTAFGPPPSPPVAVFTYVYVTLTGELTDYIGQVGYPTLDSVPPLP